MILRCSQAKGGLFRSVAALACLGLLLLPRAGIAQQQQQGLCAQIKIVISQELTIERVGFLATLQITDNDPNDPITDFSANLTFENHSLSTNGTVNDSSGLFFVQPPTLQNIASVNGGGVIGSGATATVSWFIIPTVTAGGTSPAGVRYQIGAALSGKLRGVEIPATTLQVFPSPITVEPDAQLQITYFQPRDVIGDNPFTPQVESPIPFTFGVIVKNSGYGTAHSVIINSQQPKIVENKDNLLLVAQLLGSRVNDSPLSNANLVVNLGDIPPGQATKGAWDMITTLSGTFLSINATYTHSSDLGGTETSIIQSLNAYLFAHEVLDDQPGRDNVRDFLADVSGNLDAIGNLIPDTLYESQGYVLPVSTATNAVLVGAANPFQVNLTANSAGWTYVRLDDPGQAKLPIASVVRSDGKVLNTNNYWTSIHFEPVSNIEDTYLNIFDLVNPGSVSYTVTYTNVPVNTTPPVTTMLFAGPSTFANGKYYVTPDTQMYFLSQDSSPVSIYYSLTNGPFLPAYPFSLGGPGQYQQVPPGQYQVVFYATDASGNQETNHTNILVVAGPGSLGFASVTAPTQPLFDPGDTLTVRPVLSPIAFQALSNPTPVNAVVDIFQGAVGWATVAGVPFSPTASASAALTIGGNQVDFYRYQLNGGAWSAEHPVASSLLLSNLPAGQILLSVLGRSRYGSYLDPSNAVTVNWIVAPGAPPATITAAPPTPSRSYSAQLTVGGSGVANYRYTLNNSFYQVGVPVASPIVLSNLSAGPQLVDVLGQVGGIYQSTSNPTSVEWTIDPLYGFDLSSLTSVRSVPLTNVSGTTLFNWDGRNSAGTLQPPGWYTVRVTLADALGNTNFTTELVQISQLSGTSQVLADYNRGPQNPYARGHWAVWQDQSDGNWDIYAQDLTANNPTIVKVSNGPLSQVNPRTDGRYVVWQGRQTNGNWDVYVEDLTGANGPQALTTTPSLDEVNPAIDWPWVVYQVRSTKNTNAPWQLSAYNLATSQQFQVSPSTQDEIDPDVQAGRVVWQDFRDPGPGEIYFFDLEAGQLRRITTNSYGQYNPAIYDNWIVWADNRNIELDIYGFDLLRNREIQITSTPEDETRPALNGPWMVCMENSLGPQTGNARLVHLPSLVAVSLMRTPTQKQFPTLAAGQVVWQETIANQSRVLALPLPALQPVFQNRNLVAVGDALVAYAQNAYGLLSVWGTNGAVEVTQYPSLVPAVTQQTAVLSNGVPSGANFPLVAGTFLWVKFNSTRVLDLGINNSSTLNLAAGVNVFGYTAFPDGYSAYQWLRQLGLANGLSVRMLDSSSGRWLVAEVQNGNLQGDDFPIPNVAVLMVYMTTPVTQFVPQSP
jgi:beta propeller repeat protein